MSLIEILIISIGLSFRCLRCCCVREPFFKVKKDKASENESVFCAWQVVAVPSVMRSH